MRLRKEPEGSILDIGGGGEGVIGRLYQEQVTAIDNRQEELNEAVRVMKAGGKLCIWDCEIESAYPEPFLIDFHISLPGEQISTTYGVGKHDMQNLTSILNMCIDTGLKLVYHENSKKFIFMAVFVEKSWLAAVRYA